MNGNILPKSSSQDAVSKATIVGSVLGKTVLYDSIIGNVNIVYDIDSDDIATTSEVKTYLGIT